MSQNGLTKRYICIVFIVISETASRAKKIQWKSTHEDVSRGGGGASEITSDENYFENWIATRFLELLL